MDSPLLVGALVLVDDCSVPPTDVSLSAGTRVSNRVSRELLHAQFHVGATNVLIVVAQKAAFLVHSNEKESASVAIVLFPKK